MLKLHKIIIPLIILLLFSIVYNVYADNFDDGKKYYDQKDYNKALEKFQEASKKEPNSAKIYYNIGLCYRKLKNYNDAISAFEKAEELDPKITFTKPEKFQEKLEDVRSKAGITNYYEDGKKLYKQGKYNEALNKFQLALTSNPNSAKVHYNMGLCYKQLKRYNEAVSSFEKAEELDPKISFTTTAKFNEKLTEARQKALETNTKSAKKHFNKGKELYDKKDYDGALKEFISAKKLNPNSAKTWYNLGLTYRKLEEYKHSLTALEKAKELDPQITFTKPEKFEEKLADVRKKADEQKSIKELIQWLYPRDDACIVDYSNQHYLTKNEIEEINELVTDIYIDDEIKFNCVLVEPELSGLTTGQVTTELWDELYWGDEEGILIVLSSEGIYAEADRLTDNTLQTLIDENKSKFIEGYNKGLIGLISAIEEHIINEQKAKAAKKRNGCFGVIALFIGLACLGSYVQKQKEKKYKIRLDEIEILIGELAIMLSETQLNIQFVAGHREIPDSLLEEVEELYFDAYDKFTKEQEGVSLGKNNITLLNKIASQLEKVRLLLNSINEKIDAAIDGRPIPKDEPIEKMGCYFCARPILNKDSGEIIELRQKDKIKKVLICKRCAKTYQQGEVPKIKIVNHNNKWIHWSEVPDYNPYKEFYRPQKSILNWSNIWDLNIFDEIYTYDTQINETDNSIFILDIDEKKEEYTIAETTTSAYTNSSVKEAPGSSFKYNYSKDYS